MKFIAFTYLIFIITTCNAQTFNELVQLSSDGYYKEAINGFERLLKLKLKPTEKVKVNKQLLFTYVKNFNYQSAYKMYANNQFESFTEEENQNIIHLLRALGKYEQARPILQKSKLKTLETDWIDWPLAQQQKENKDLKKVNINLKQHCYGISFYKNGLIVPNEKVEKDKTISTQLYYYEKLSDTIFKEYPALIIENRNGFYTGTPFFNQNDSTIYFSSSITNKQKVGNDKKNKPLTKNKLELLKYGKSEGISPVFENSTSSSSLQTPFIYNDSILFFSQQTATNKLDIFYVIKNSSKWSKPIKLEGANSTQQDLYPFIKDDNFYFSSRGFKNYGGLDLFKGKLKLAKDGTYQVENIENISDLNSTADDFAFIINEDNQTYFASNRANYNNDNIYTTVYHLPIEVLISFVDNNMNPLKNVNVFSKDEKLIGITDENGKLSTTILKNDTLSFFTKHEDYFKETFTIIKPNKNQNYSYSLSKKPSVYILNNSITKEPIPNATITVFEKKEPEGWLKKATTTTNNYGEWDYDFDASKQYKVEIEAKNYQKREIYIPKEEREITEIDFFAEVTPLEMSPNTTETFTINNIYFDHNSAVITEESKLILNNLVNYLLENNNKKIELSAHTDCIGPDDYNLVLSKKRAASCLRFIVESNINKERVKAIGYGELYLLNDCKRQRLSKELAKKNRRIEIKFLN